MAAVVSYLLLSLPAFRVAAGGAAVAICGVAAGAASERWMWPAEAEVPPRRRRRRAAERRHAGRLPRPRSHEGDGDGCWALDASGGDVARCDAFLATVERWPRDVWLAVGRAADESPRMRDAERSLTALVSARELHVTTWLVRDRVETAATPAGYRAASRRSEYTALSPAEHRAMAIARDVVDRAALAHLLRPWLAADAHDALTGPVAVVPIPCSPNPHAPL